MSSDAYLAIDNIHLGSAEDLLALVEPGSVACSIWSPPYHVGKDYERDYTYEGWVELLAKVIGHHATVLRPGGFLVVNIADILCFKDPSIPRLMAANLSRHKSSVTREQVLQAWAEHPNYNRYQIAALLGCSEQTVDRRMKGNNIRGGKYADQTRVKLVGGLIEELALRASLYLYDRRVWVKDPAWENSKWHTMSYRAVDEFEYLYVFWRPGVTVIDRAKLTKKEWIDWGSRAVWYIPSVRANHEHEAMFPLELPRRLIRLLTREGDLVLDCFVGSGTTAVAAITEGRHYLGIDRVPRYVASARRACQGAKQRQRPAHLDETNGERPASPVEPSPVYKVGARRLQPRLLDGSPTSAWPARR